MKDIIDESYLILRRLDFSGDQLIKLVFLVKEIETKILRVLKLFTCNEQNDFLKEMNNLLLVESEMGTDQNCVT